MLMKHWMSSTEPSPRNQTRVGFTLQTISRMLGYDKFFTKNGEHVDLFHPVLSIFLRLILFYTFFRSSLSIPTAKRGFVSRYEQLFDTRLTTRHSNPNTILKIRSSGK